MLPAYDNNNNLQVYKLVVNLHHFDLPSLTNRLVVYVHVVDENDNAPVFEKQRYHANVHQVS